MATVSKGRTFVSGETVTPAKLNELVDNATVTGIVDADVSASAAIALSKLATGALPAAITATTANLVNASVTAAKLDGAQSGSAPIYGCRAWVSFDGTKDTTGAASTANTNRLIFGAGNVSSVLRNATGNYTVTFTTAMQDTNYSCVATAQSGQAIQIFTAGVEIISASQVKIYTADAGFTSNVSFGTAADRLVSVAIFR